MLVDFKVQVAKIMQTERIKVKEKDI